VADPTEDRCYLRQVLVPLSVAMHVLSRDKQYVLELVDMGRLRWVFDVAAPSGQGARRELRFWLGELFDPRAQIETSEADAIDCVVGHSTEAGLCVRTVCNLLWVARPHLQRLAVTGELTIEDVRGVRSISRSNLCALLSRRLVS
jgi:hypothetical protein